MLESPTISKTKKTWVKAGSMEVLRSIEISLNLIESYCKVIFTIDHNK